MLTVYKASAGSGKTFTLTIEYIKMLVQNPTSYKSILAVTFTNKATDEMKSRILSKLYGMWKQLPDSADYMSKVCADLDISPAIASKRAGEALHLLIHNYNNFRVVTIDTFFQSVLRNLARELDLTANMRIELNDTQIEGLTVDRMIEDLKPNDELLRWIMQYINDCISNDNGWNVIRLIKDFGKNIFKSFYKENSEALAATIEQPKFFQNYTDELRKVMVSAEKNMQAVANDFFNTLDNSGVSIDELARKERGAASYFVKLKRGDYAPAMFKDKKTGQLMSTYVKAMEEPESWLTKATLATPRGEDILEIARERLSPMLSAAVETRRREWGRYQAAKQILGHLHQLRLLGCIDRNVRVDNAQSNRFLLSDTQYMLNQLIGKDDAPFIYEKTGTHISHIMIDEFQDTSTIQWSNFKVLMLECLSHEFSGTSLIVGDVKQSIYRWREGDWQLLNNIDKQFANTPFTPHQEHLQTNYRSEHNIIEFNNAFFRHAADLEQQRIAADGSTEMAEQLKKAYADVEQKVPAHRPRQNSGYVEITLFPKNASDDTQDISEITMQRVAETIDMLLSEGVRPHDIAVLTRNNEGIRNIARYLSEHMPQVPVVSSEAYRLDSSIAVNAIIWTLRLILHPTDEIMQANVAMFYKMYVETKQTSVEEAEESDSRKCVIDGVTAQEVTTAILETNAGLETLPLFDIAEHLQRIYRLDEIEGQSAFLCTLFDVINKFAIDNPSDIEGFLEQWDNNYCQTSIQTEDANGINMLTIHRSKGLEFDNVIVPFCDWKLNKGGLIWCKPTESPFNKLPLVPVSSTVSTMEETIFEDDCRKEAFENTIDNLNMLFVAFTRASKNLFVMGRQADRNYRSALIEQCIPLIDNDIEEASVTGYDSDEEETTFTFGSLAIRKKACDDNADTASCTKKKGDENVFEPSISRTDLTFTTYPGKTEFRQSNDSMEFVKGESEQQQVTYIKKGNLLHSIFSCLRTADDLPRVMKNFEEKGLLTDVDSTAEEIGELIAKRISTPQTALWFEAGWHLYNECTMLTADPKDPSKMKEYRPDRVMEKDGHFIVVDFKFASPTDSHRKQVRTYMEQLYKMGHTDVEGYLWYVYPNKIEKIG